MKNPSYSYKLRLLVLTHFLVVSSVLYASPEPDSKYKNSFRFIENKSQWASEVLFRANIPDGFIFLQNAGFQYSFYDADRLRKFHHPEQKLVKQFGTHNRNARAENLPPIEEGQVRAHGVKVSFLGHNENYSIQKTQMGVERRNYFVGNRPEKHAQNVRSFGKVIYTEIYNQIDFQFYTQFNRLKYEFLVRPHGNPHEIQLQYDYAKHLFLKNGNLIVQTSINEFSEQKPYCYQIINGKKQEIPSRFVLKGNILSYEFPAGYDKSKMLIIDPTVIFATYSGSVSDNWGFTSTYDESGNMYTGGIIFGVDFPTTTGAFSVDFAGETDIVIHKYNKDGSKLLYGTYLGGKWQETPHSLIVDKDDRLVIMGATSSTDFPVSSNAFQRRFGGGATLKTGIGLEFKNGSDAYIAILNTSGDKIEGCTYLGGNGTDGIMSSLINPMVFNYGDQARGDVGTDAEGNIYVVSSTNSTNFPTKNAIQDRFAGKHDAVIVKMSSNLEEMLWGTYYGGSDFDAGFSMSITQQGDLYVAGSTRSNNIKTHSGALHPNFQGFSDGFLLRIDAKNGTFQNATYLGTDRWDMGYLTDTDIDGNAYLFGLTVGEYPIQNSKLKNYGRGQFIHKLDATLSKSIFSTRFGSEQPLHALIPNLSPTAFRVTDCGDIYLAGWGGATNKSNAASAMQVDSVTNSRLPTTPDAIRRKSDGSDFYIMILDKEANHVLYGSYFGGYHQGTDHDHVDGGTSRFSKDGTIYHASCACRTNAQPTTSGSWSTKNPASTNSKIAKGSGGCNMHSIKLNIKDLKAEFKPFDEKKQEVSKIVCSPADVYLKNQSQNANRYKWEIENIGTFTETNPKIKLTKPGLYKIRLTAFNDASCLEQSVKDTIRVLGSDYSISPDTSICSGNGVEIQATGGASYRWRVITGDGLKEEDKNKPNPTVTPSENSKYAVVITTAEGCQYDTSTVVSISNPITLNFQTSVHNICDRVPTISFINKSEGADHYTWNFGNGKIFKGKNPPDLKYDKLGQYTITLQGEHKNCQTSDSMKINIISDRVIADFEVELIQLCDVYPTVQITNKSQYATSYFWDFGNGKTFQGTHPPKFKYTKEGDFTITLTAKNATCQDSTQRKINVYSELISDFIANIKKSENQLICASEAVQLEVSGGVRYSWSPTKGLNDATIPNPIAKPTETTEYTVTIYSPRGCGIDTTIRVEVAPKIDITYAVKNTIECGKRALFDFENHTKNAHTFKWDMGNGQIYENENPPSDFKYEKSGRYQVVLEASNQACSERKEFQIVASNVVPPNVITPNGDGKNDQFDIGVRENGWRLEIYDRWGKSVYKSDNYNNNWGEKANNTMYFYRLTSPDNETCTGWLKIIK